MYKLSGIILLLTPPCILPIVTTAAALVSGMFLLTIVWREFTICEAVTIGSVPVHGVEPWVWIPSISILNSSTAAIIPRGLTCTWPALIWDHMCNPKIASTFGFSKTPSLTISSAPPSSPAGAPSSAGWNINFTDPGIWSFISYNTFATPSKIAVCVSCPHACITGTFSPLYIPVIFEAQGKSALSLTGRPSISALRATTGPGLPPFKTATTPVFAIPVWGFKPILINSCSILLAVLNSLLLNSAFSWNQCLNSITSFS